MTLDILDTKLGRLILIASKGELVYCNWNEPECERKLEKVLKFQTQLEKFENIEGEYERDLIPENHDKEIILLAKKELKEFFSGRRKIFTVKTGCSGTDFQKRVWCELSKLAYGEKTTYKKIGERIGNIKGVRAVAAACGANPVAIIIPCHRVLGSNGEIGGYTGGILKKKALLEIEKAGNE